ncbi:hypothetical protein EEL30_18440 [Brevibacillus laterosporus]|uniref:TniQ family protein n=1 Tax=Brevibacillus laterosporus TaxID=1465 RepID=A0A518VAT4_BRELA|nr:hypothetical protein EEL30_18440 [Brevibacillus laterosporus]
MFNESSYAWRKEWIRSLESPWSILEKFKYANETSSYDALKIFGITTVKKIRLVGERYRNLVTLTGFDLKTTRKILSFDLIATNRQYLHELFGYFSHRHNEHFFVRNQLWYCIECMRNGFHSILHQVTFLHYCPFHMIPLQDACPKCTATFLYECNDAGFSSPYQCKCNFSFLEIGENEKFFKKWSKEETLRCDFVKKWITLNEKQRKTFSNIYMYPSEELKNSPYTLQGLLHTLSPYGEKNKFYISINSTPQIKKIKGYREIIENRTGEEINTKQIQATLRYQKLQEDLYESYEKVISSIARHLRRTLLLKHTTCINRYYTDPHSIPRCPYAFAYLHWRSQVERYRDPGHVISISRPMNFHPEDVRFPFHTHNEFFEKLFTLWRAKVSDITFESRATLKWVVGRSIAEVANCIFKQYLRYAEINPEYFHGHYIIPFQVSNIRPFFLQIDFADLKPPKMYLEVSSNYSHDTPQLSCPFKTVKNKRDPQRMKKCKDYKST